jgi:transcriptional regulator with XRE-family HTH domain
MNGTQRSTFGELMRHWRAARRMSQLDLGLEADVSARHISFIETGRANPSREMILMLANVLDIPLRERNALLHAAGYAPIYPETSLDDPRMVDIRQALELILKQHEHFGAIAFDRYWDIIMVNRAYARFINLLLGNNGDTPAPYTILPSPRPNLLLHTFDPAGLRPYIANWEEVAQSVLARFYHETMWNRDDKMRELLQTIRAYPGVPARWCEPSFDLPQSPIIPLELSLGDRTLRIFSTLTTLGSPLDITLQELRIESYHPADEETARIGQSLAAV